MEDYKKGPLCEQAQEVSDELVKAYKEFRVADVSLMTELCADKLDPEKKKLALFVVQQFKDCSIKELRDFADVLNKVADEQSEWALIGYDKDSDYNAAVKYFAGALEIHIDRALAERGLTRSEDTYDGRNSTCDGGNSTGDSTPKRTVFSFFKRIFG